MERGLGDWANIDRHDWIANVVDDLLRQSGVTKDHLLTGPELYERVKQLGFTLPISESRFSQYLTAAVKRGELASRPGRGYFPSERPGSPDGLYQQQAVRERSGLDCRSLDPNSLGRIDAARIFRASGESQRHKRLKEAIANNPTLIGCLPSLGRGETEFRLPSGDALDVFFRNESNWLAIEVKTAVSVEADLVRGLFQCVKYQAVLDAWRRVLMDDVIEVRVILALEANLPNSLLVLCDALRVDVVVVLN